MALLLQNLKDVAGQVDASVVPVTEQAAGQVVDGIDHRGGIGKDTLFDADHLIADFQRQRMGHLLACTKKHHLNAIGVGVAAKAADQRVVLQLLVQTAAQPQHSTVHHRANAAHTFHITGALHLAQRVTDHGAAYPQLGGKVYLGGQAVGLGIAPVGQLLQQACNNAVADHSAAQAAGRCQCGIFHGWFLRFRAAMPPRTSYKRAGWIPPQPLLSYYSII